MNTAQFLAITPLRSGDETKTSFHSNSSFRSRDVIVDDVPGFSRFMKIFVELIFPSHRSSDSDQPQHSPQSHDAPRTFAKTISVTNVRGKATNASPPRIRLIAIHFCRSFSPLLESSSFPPPTSSSPSPSHPHYSQSQNISLSSFLHPKHPLTLLMRY